MQLYRTKQTTLIAAAITVLIATAPSRADNRGGEATPPRTFPSNVVIFEARVGSPHSARDEISAAIARAFENEGYRATPAAIASALGARMPRPGVEDRRLTTASVLQPLSDGFLAWTQGRFEDAEALLSKGLRVYERNVALVVTDNGNQDVVFHAMAALALSQWAIGDRKRDRAKLDAARESMLNLHRYFPTRRFSSEEFAPDAIEFHRKIGKEAAALGTGSVSIRVDNANAMVFVDGQMRGTGRADLAGMLPGMHDLYVQEPGRGDTGRRFKLNTSANQDAIVEIAWDAHTAFWATSEFTGLTYITEAERKAKLPAHASAVASWGQPGLIGVVERIDVDGRPALRATLYGAHDVAVGTYTTLLSTDDPDTSARELARGLTKASPPKVRDDDIHAPASSSTRAASPSSASYLVPSLLTGAGLTATIVGAATQLRKEPPDPGAPKYLRSDAGTAIQITGGVATAAGLYLLLRPRDGGRTPSLLTKGLVLSGSLVMVGSTALHTTAPIVDDDIPSRRYSTAGFIVGSAGLGVGMYRWVRETRDTSRLSAAAVGMGITCAASGAFLFAVDEDEGNAGRALRTYWDTGLYGVVSGGAGLALLALGWWGASHASTSTPVVALGNDHTMLGWSGTF